MAINNTLTGQGGTGVMNSNTMRPGFAGFKPLKVATGSPLANIGSKVSIGSGGYPIAKKTATPATAAAPTPAPAYTAPPTPTAGVISAPAAMSVTSPNTPSAPVKGLLSAAGGAGLSFPGLVGDIASASRPSGVQTGLIGALAKNAKRQSEIGGRVQGITDKYAPEIARVGKLGAGAVAGNLSTGSNVVGSGNAAIASQSASSRMSALAQAQEAELAGVGQEISAESQAANAFNQALGGANTQQSTTLGGLGSAAGFGAPTLGQYGQTFYNPLGGANGGGDASGIVGGWASYLAGGGDPNQVPAAVSGNPVLWQQTLQAAKQQNPGFDVNTALGAAAGRQSNASTAGSAVINTAAQGYQQSTQGYNTMTAFNNAAHTQAQNLINILGKTGINATDPTVFNKAINSLQRNFSSTDYAAFTTALTELQSMYSQLLQVGGGTPTGNEEKSLSVLSPNSSAAAIGAAISQLEQAAYAKLKAQYDQANSYLSQLQGGGVGGGAPAAAGGGETINTSIGNFVKGPDGKWVVAQ